MVYNITEEEVQPRREFCLCLCCCEGSFSSDTSGTDGGSEAGWLVVTRFLEDLASNPPPIIGEDVDGTFGLGMWSRRECGERDHRIVKGLFVKGVD